MNSKTKSTNSNSVFDRMVNQITNNSSVGSAAREVSSEGVKGLKHLMKLGGVHIGDSQKRRDSGDSQPSPSSARPSIDGGAALNGSQNSSSNNNNSTMGASLQVSSEDGRISLEVAERMLRWHAEAVGRMIELSPPSEA